MEIVELESMKGSELIAYADKLGVKVSCNKERISLKESKAKVIDKIVAFEKEHSIEVKKSLSNSKKSENVDILLSYLTKANIKYKERFYKNNSLKCMAVYANTRKNKIMEIYPQKNGYALYIAKDIDLSGYDVISSNYGLNQRLNVYDVSIVSKILERC